MEFNMVRQERRVEVETTFGTVQGRMRCHSSVRTLDDLNFPRADYLILEDPTGRGAESPTASNAGPFAIRKDSILFVHELEQEPFSLSRGNPGKFWVSVVEYRVGPLFLRGTVHTPPGGEPIARLNQMTHRFLALTSVSVSGPGREFVAAFVAVNRHHILSARELDGVSETVERGEGRIGSVDDLRPSHPARR